MLAHENGNSANEFLYFLEVARRSCAKKTNRFTLSNEMYARSHARMNDLICNIVRIISTASRCLKIRRKVQLHAS
jgi:hypothetical protein